MLKNLSKNSILVRFTLVLVAILIIPFSIFLSITSRNITDIENKSADQYISSNLKVVASTVDGILSNLEHGHTSLALNTSFIHAMKNLKPYAERELYPDYLQTRLIKEQLVDTSIKNNYIDSVYAYSFLSNRIFTTKVNWSKAFNNYDKAASKWLISYETNQTENPWLLTNSVENEAPILASYRRIKELDMPLYGLISINVKAETVADILQEAANMPDSYCFVTDDNGNYIGSDPTINRHIYDTIYQGIKRNEQHANLDDREYFYSSQTSNYSNFTYVIAAPRESIETISPLLKNINLVFIISTLAILFVFMAISYRYFYTPIQALFQKMHKVQDGDLDARLPESSSYEISYINENFNDMVSNLQSLINENYVNQLISKDAQLKSIRNQLNEHFLYNTLDTIHWKARLENAPESCDMIFSLAKFYRLSLSSGKDFIPVTDVIEIIDNYLQIQKIRMGDMFVYNIDLQENLEHYEVLKYLFQPIVENALIHGGHELTRQLVLTIRFYEENGSLVFSVEDNGVGMSAQQLAHLREELSSDATDTDGLFALKTLQSQLHAEYGADCNLHLESSPDNGCLVYFVLPISKLGGAKDVENTNR